MNEIQWTLTSLADCAKVRFAMSDVSEAANQPLQIWAGLANEYESGSGLPELRSEGFLIDWSTLNGSISVIGYDQSGLMYGLLELAEQLQDNRMEKKDRIVQNPAIGYRGIKCNLPWEPYQLSESSIINLEECRKLELWYGYIDMLARSRYNVLTLWSQHPYDRMFRLNKYPEACAHSHEEMEQWQQFWTSLFAYARNRGVDVYLFTWNIMVSDAFAKHHHIPKENFDSPLVRDYLKECVRTLVDTYPDLAGLGTCTGERMNGIPFAVREQFVLEVYFRGLQEAGHRIPFVHRSHMVNDPLMLQAAITVADYEAPVYIDLKFNNSHGLSMTELKYGADHKKLNEYNRTLWEPTPRNYKMLWHIRNEETYLLQWGDPEFVRKHMIENNKECSAGYFFGTERSLPFLEPYFHKRVNSRPAYEFQRRWMMPMMWGRYGYNPNLPVTFWHKQLDRRYGQGLGESLLSALTSASRIVPEMLSFHEADWDPWFYTEGCMGFGIHSVADRKHFKNRSSRFVTVEDFIYHPSMDDSILSIFVHGNRLAQRLPIESYERTPLQVADRLEAYADTAEQEVTRLRENANPAPFSELDVFLIDIEIWIALGRYYADKIRSSTKLFAFQLFGVESHRDESLNWIRNAVQHWELICELAEPIYRNHVTECFGPFHWSLYLDHARRDEAIIRSALPYSELSADFVRSISPLYKSDGRGSGYMMVFEPEKYLNEDGITELWTSVPEISVDDTSLYGWDENKALAARERMDGFEVDFGKFYGEGQYGTSYVAFSFTSSKAEIMKLTLRTIDFVKIWVNGDLAYDTGTFSMRRNEYTEVAVKVKQGLNRFLIKDECNAFDVVYPRRWGFYLKASRPL